MNFLVWVLVAVAAGLLARYVMHDGGHGLAWDVTLGLIGSVVVSWVFANLWVSADRGMITVVVVAALGAAGLIVAQRKIWPGVA
jgi:uncharacterized membrane protein YeaQ/YmgE (transglycosylase-associated protein family)